MVPPPHRRGIEPHQAGKRSAQPPHPHGARLFVPMIDTAPRLHNLVWAHGGISHQDDPVVVWIGAQHLGGGYQLRCAATIVLPEVLIEEIVEVEVHEMLEDRKSV